MKKFIPSLEVILLAIVGILIFLGLSSVDAFEEFVEWSREHEDYELDELALLVPTLLFIVSGVAFMRWRESVRLNTVLMQKNEELEAKQGELIQSVKLNSLGEMAAGIAHELKQPLNIIGLLAELTMDQVEEQDYDDLKMSCEKITNQTQRAVDLINHLKNFGRDTSRDLFLSNDLHHILNDALMMILMQPSRGMSLEKKLAPKLPSLICNAIQIEQVFINLLTNAQDALEGQKGKVIVRSFQEEEHLVVEVEDSGQGIPTENLDKIFNSFFTTKPMDQGTGLGLSICHTIVEEHGGKLEVESEVGKGSLFRVTLPINQPAPVSSTNGTPS